MDNTYLILSILVIAAVTAALRFIPFAVFSANRKTPKIIVYLGKCLPYAIMAMLVVYCLKDATFTSFPFALPEFIAIAAVALIHLWRRNTLLSVAGGTVFYMILVQFVFK